jgi:hypothetical protein
MKMPRLIAIAALAVLAVPAAVQADAGSKESMMSPAQVIQKALASKRQALEICGVRWSGEGTVRVVARFSLSFDGRVKSLRFEGLPASRSSSCLSHALSDLRLPARLAYIVREIALPLPLAPTVAGLYP